jgi:hypothetical protein
MGVSGKSKSQAQTNRKTSYSDELWDDCAMKSIWQNSSPSEDIHEL